ncbi:hypothetical protein GCM10009605_34960 [Nocardiopsis composta]
MTTGAGPRGPAPVPFSAAAGPAPPGTEPVRGSGGGAALREHGPDALDLGPWQT